MANESTAPAEIARLMREYRFVEAMDCARAHLAEHPRDLETLLRLGLCCLLSRAEDEFLGIHARAQRLVSSQGRLPASTDRLWRLYQHQLARLTTPLVVAGSTALGACNQTPTETAAPEPVVSAAPSVSSAAEPETAAPETASAAPEPTASVAASASAAAAPTPPVATSVTSKPPKASAHRYSAGVYRPPKPATHHKYSGGVYRK